jgi:hypothetical protein
MLFRVLSLVEWPILTAAQCADKYKLVIAVIGPLRMHVAAIHMQYL